MSHIQHFGGIKSTRKINYIEKGKSYRNKLKFNKFAQSGPILFTLSIPLLSVNSSQICL